MTDLREALRALVEELKRRRDGWTASHLEVRRAYGSCADSIGLLLDEHPARASDVPAHQGSRNEMTDEEIDTAIATIRKAIKQGDPDAAAAEAATALFSTTLKMLSTIAFAVDDIMYSQRRLSGRD